MTLLERQAELPPSIQLFRYWPSRASFSWANFDPARVDSVEKLPPYLILGDLDPESCTFSPQGWSAVWQGTEPQTHFDVRYLADDGRFEIRQTWRDVEGGFSTYPARVTLERIIAETLYMRFPGDWDSSAKMDFERRFQLHYVEQIENTVDFCGIPDGVFRTIAVPIAIKDLRSVRQWLEETSNQSGLRYPISAEAKLNFQAISYVEGKAPDWTRTGSVVLGHSLAETGLVPHGLPVKETAPDGSVAWTLRRDVYVLFIGVPFAGLTDLLERISTTNGSVRRQSDPTLRVELQPTIIPTGYEYQAESVTSWDKTRATRSFWLLGQVGRERSVPTVEEVKLLDQQGEDSLRVAENISDEVTAMVQSVQGKGR